ncbi:hypothetical protein CPLU01_04355 [Colletotrichum plurivorum]|uniref:Uncharacterized protein n=1 Tax=Colletotrichum plurivorum TaxID=2175906 RepID=A0A8H6KQB7_9PEZI|nr:hypothetical protein CPLU01_04355 [Colletotrichum plurivorum]
MFNGHSSLRRRSRDDLGMPADGTPSNSDGNQKIDSHIPVKLKTINKKQDSQCQKTAEEPAICRTGTSTLITRLGDIPPGAAHSPPDVSDRPQTRRGHYTHETKPSSRNPFRHLIRPRGGCVDPFDMTLPGSSSDRPRAPGKVPGVHVCLPPFRAVNSWARNSRP